MAEVHLARQRGPKRFQKLVVVKTVHSKLTSRPALAEALLDEARIAALVKHPNVVDIYDLGEQNGTYFIAMEYLDGESLASILRAGRLGPRLDPFSTARIVADSAAGLHAAHELRNLKGESMELVHQDVTPGNVIVLYTGQVKLVDFGVAKVSTSADAGLVRGKAGYLAPELFEGSPADRRSDVFALGVVLWEALTLRRLFHSATERETFDKIRSGEVLPPSRFMPHVTRDLDEVCMRALARDPAQRYQTARAMQDDLGLVLRAANWGGDNEPIARYMRSTFSMQIAARQELLRGLDADEEPSAALLGQLAASVDAMAASGDSPVIGAHGTGRMARLTPTDLDGEVLEVDDLAIAPPGSAPLLGGSRRRWLAVTAGLATALLVILLVVAVGREGAPAPSLAEGGLREPDAAGATTEPVDAGIELATVTVDAAPLEPPVGPVPVRDEGSRRDGRDRGARPARTTARATDDDTATRLTTAKSLYKDGLQRFVGGDTAGAITQFQAAVAREPGYAPAHRGLGLAYQRKGDRDRAGRELRRYLELAPTAADTAQIRERLENLR